MKRLERAGIISGYRAILNWTMLGARFDAWAEVEVAVRSGAERACCPRKYYFLWIARVTAEEGSTA